MNRKAKTALEGNIAATLQAYRYAYEIKIIESELSIDKENNVEEPKKEKKGVLGFIKGLFTTTTTIVCKGRNEKDLEQAKDNYETYVSALPKDINIGMLEDEDAFQKTLSSFFKDDDGSAKIGMALELVGNESNPDLPKLLRPEKSRKAPSFYLFGDKEELTKINDFFAKACAQIGATKTSLLSGGFLHGLAASNAARFESRPLSKLFANKSNALQPKELLMLSSLVGGGHIKMRHYKKKTRRMGPAIQASLDSELAYSLAAAITLWKFGQGTANGKDEKKNLDLLLKMIGDIRSSAEQLAIMEQKDKEENLKKIRVCNNAIAFLGNIR